MEHDELIVGGSELSVRRAVDLLRIFHPAEDTFAVMRAVEAVTVPEPYRHLLAHHSHMTVAMERHHGGPVSLRVVQVADQSGHGGGYAREILLMRGDGTVVQYGIVRLDLSIVDAPTEALIRAGRVPLGRVLIEAGIHREVHDVSLLEVRSGPALCRLFGSETCQPTFGRVATMSLSGWPAMELLEVACPPRD